MKRISVFKLKQNNKLSEHEALIQRSRVLKLERDKNLSDTKLKIA